jgi:hypothetical protein
MLTPTAVTREAARILHQKCNFIGSCNKQYDDSFKNGGATVKGKFGPTLKIRMPNEYTVRSGLTMSAQDTTESSVDLTVSTVKGVDVSFTSTELALSLDDFSQRILEPAMSRLAANIEADAISMYKDVYNLYDGDAAAFAFESVTAGRQMLTDNLAPMDDGRVLVLNTTHATKFINDTKGLFHDQATISKQYRDGVIGKVNGFNAVYENTLLLPHTTGTAAKASTYLVNGASQTGSYITVDTGATTFVRGDVFTITGVYRVHPETKVSTGVLQQFVVAPVLGTGFCGNGTGASATTTGTSTTQIGIYPAIVTSGGGQNVTGSPADNAAITKVGAGASETLVQSMAFHRDAFAFVTADLPMPEGVDFAARQVVDGISISMVRDFSISDRSFPCRIDVLYGYKAVRPQLAARIHNDG